MQHTSKRSVRRSGRRPIVGAIVGVGALVAVAFVVAWAMDLASPSALRLRFSEPYELATRLVREDPLVEDFVGTVHGFGLLPRGSVRTEGADGWCELELDVRGAQADGVFESRLERREGRWFWEWANFRMKDGTVISLAVP
jgi:hypothetical protein